MENSPGFRLMRLLSIQTPEGPAAAGRRPPILRRNPVSGRLLLLALTAVSAFAHDPITTKLTWSKEISRIFQRRCMPCHQSGGKASFALTSWEEARPWAVAIREEVTGRRMPPWNAVRGFGDFRDDPSLTQEELQLIADWVNGGAPAGDPKFLSDQLPKVWRDPPSQGFAAAPTGRLAGLRVPPLPRGAKLQAVLVRPSGETLPLLWIRSFNPAAGRTFLFRQPLEAPPGSRIVTTPASLGPRLAQLWAPARATGASRGPAPVAE